MDNYTDRTTKKYGKRYEVSLYEDRLVESKGSLKEKKEKKQEGSLFYLGYVGQVGFVIALPIAGGVGIGSYIDTKWGTYPKLTLAGLVIGLVISVVNFIAVIKEIIKSSEKK